MAEADRRGYISNEYEPSELESSVRGDRPRVSEDKIMEVTHTIDSLRNNAVVRRPSIKVSLNIHFLTNRRGDRDGLFSEGCSKNGAKIGGMIHGWNMEFCEFTGCGCDEWLQDFEPQFIRGIVALSREWWTASIGLVFQRSVTCDPITRTATSERIRKLCRTWDRYQFKTCTEQSQLKLLRNHQRCPTARSWNARWQPEAYARIAKE